MTEAMCWDLIISGKWSRPNARKMSPLKCVGSICFWHLLKPRERHLPDVLTIPKNSTEHQHCIHLFQTHTTANNGVILNTFKVMRFIFSNKPPLALWNLCQGTEYIFLFLKLWLDLCGQGADGVIYLVEGRSNTCAIKGLERCIQFKTDTLRRVNQFSSIQKMFFSYMES